VAAHVASFLNNRRFPVLKELAIVTTES